MTILELTGMVFVIIRVMFYGRISLNSVVLLLLVEFCEWFKVGIDAYMPCQRYQVKPHSSLWFSAVCAAAIVHISTKRINLLHLK